VITPNRVNGTDSVAENGYLVSVGFPEGVQLPRCGLIHAYVFDGNTNAPFGELHIKRESNLTPDELAAMKQRLSGLTLS